MNVKVKTAAEKKSARSIAAKKSAATRKHNKAVAMAKKEAGKSKQEVRREAETAIEGIPMVSGFTLEKGAPYAQVSADNTLKRGYTIAGFIVAGFFSMTTNGLPEKYKKGNTTFLRLIIGKTAYEYWSSDKKWFDVGTAQMTEAGRKEISSSMGRDKGFYTRIAIVNALKKGIQSGGTIKVVGENHGEKTIKFMSPISAQA